LNFLLAESDRTKLPEICLDEFCEHLNAAEGVDCGMVKNPIADAEFNQLFYCGGPENLYALYNDYEAIRVPRRSPRLRR
jgi:hypothetical protein